LLQNSLQISEILTGEILLSDGICPVLQEEAG